MLSNDIQNKFNEIYKTNAWGNGSGWGSSVNHNKSYISFVQKYLEKYQIKSVFDIGCGDWQIGKNIVWQYNNNYNVEYTGGDISSYIIEQNKIKYSDLNTKFIIFDIVNDDIPDVDLIIVKDVLQHLNNFAVKMALRKLQKCKRVLIINDTNNLSMLNNSDINTGDFRCIDINQRPFTSSYGHYREIYHYRPSFQYKYIFMSLVLIGILLYFSKNIHIKIVATIIILYLVIRYCPYKSIHEIVN